MPPRIPRHPSGKNCPGPSPNWTTHGAHRSSRLATEPCEPSCFAAPPSRSAISSSIPTSGRQRSRHYPAPPGWNGCSTIPGSASRSAPWQLRPSTPAMKRRRRHGAAFQPPTAPTTVPSTPRECACQLTALTTPRPRVPPRPATGILPSSRPWSPRLTGFTSRLAAIDAGYWNSITLRTNGRRRPSFRDRRDSRLQR